MAYKMNIGGPGGTESLYQQTDCILLLTVYKNGQTDEAISNGTAIPEDVTGFTFEWKVQRKSPPAQPPFADIVAISGGAITITGVYNVSPVLNTQQVQVAITAAALAVDADIYTHGLRRVDSGHNTVMVVGDCHIEIAP